MRSVRFMLIAVPLIAAVSACSTPPPPAPPPPPPSTAVTTSLKVVSDIAKDDVMKSVALVPEAKLSFQPTKEVRTFAQLFGHIADSNYFFCATAKGEKAPDSSAEKLTKTAELKKALADSFAYCDAVFASLNDTTGAAMVKVEGLDVTKLATMSFNTAHNFEHYGNLVTYMRMNKMVPPSSQPAPAAAGK
jgi:uncharacterized damage-inducible protein DinB